MLEFASLRVTIDARRRSDVARILVLLSLVYALPRVHYSTSSAASTNFKQGPAVAWPPYQTPEPSSLASKMRVAVCITGNTRSFYLASVHESIARNLIAPLRAEGGVVDVFFHVALADRPRHQTKTAKSMKRMTLAAMKSFKPVSITSFNRTLQKVSEQANCPPGAAQAASSYPYALLRASQCMDQVARHEHTLQRKYDWIVKTRPDIALGDPITILNFRNDTIQMNQHTPGTQQH
jgi:hypothetical protein